MGAGTPVHTFTTYMSPEDRFGLVYEHTPSVGRPLGWRVEMSDPVQFTDELLKTIAECEDRGSVVVRQGKPPLPDYLFPEEHL